MSSRLADLFICPCGSGGQEKEELKLVGNERIGKNEEGMGGFKKGEFRCTQTTEYCHVSGLQAQPL